MTMPSNHGPTEPAGSPDPRRPEAEPDATEERRTSWRLRRRDKSDKAAAEERIRNQGTWVDVQLQQAMARGDFDDLPGHGKPIVDLDGRHDPDWWLKRFVQREDIHGLLPPALQVRRDDADLDDRLDTMAAERQVREAVEEFNEAVRRARFQPLGGPPMITDPRDVDTEVAIAFAVSWNPLM